MSGPGDDGPEGYPVEGPVPTASPSASTLPMSDREKAVARERRKRIDREGFGFARALKEAERA